jgi:hypothetical protein
MIETNRDEMKFFYVRDEKLTKKKLGVFVVARDQESYDSLTGYISRAWRIRAVDERPLERVFYVGRRCRTSARYAKLFADV